MKSKKIFALDIGTRKVMGLLAQAQGDALRVLDVESKEHPTRAMSAGQIQDVSKVTQVVKQVVSALGKRTGEPLGQAAVAVAGRNLRTLTGRAAVDAPKDRALQAQELDEAVFQALEDALMRISLQGESSGRYYCVGYVVSRFTLDGEILTQPLGHRGGKLEAEVLATFLPWQVLESQFTVLENAGLEPCSVTLEPIAALQAVVDSDLRQFDLALVDVGAGTSDIAVVAEGLVRSFGMVPCAGDFVTEKLASHFLLDFSAAERVKRAASLLEGPIDVMTVLQQPLRLPPAEILAAMAPAVRELAERVARRILELRSGQPPQMVLCVGGGSRTAGFFAELAGALGIAPHRVGTRPPGHGMGLKDASGLSLGPETATPLGIACVAASAGGVKFRRVFVNEEPFFLLEMGRPLTVLSTLMAAGVSAKRIFGWPGESLSYTVNGEFRILKPKGGVPARMRLNEKPAELDDKVDEGDRIEFVPAEAGAASASLGEALGLQPASVTVNGHLREVWPSLTVDGQAASAMDPLRDRVSICVCAVAVADALSEEERRQGHVHCNGHRVALDALLRDGDKIETLEHNRTELPPVISQVMEEASNALPTDAADTAPAPAAVSPKEIPAARASGERGPSLASGGEPATKALYSPERVIRIRLNGEWVDLSAAQSGALLVDVLKKVSLPTGGIAGRRLKLFINGLEAGFTSPLHSGADVRVFFE